MTKKKTKINIITTKLAYWFFDYFTKRNEKLEKIREKLKKNRNSNKQNQSNIDQDLRTFLSSRPKWRDPLKKKGISRQARDDKLNRLLLRNS